MLDKIDRKLLALLQEDCTLSLQVLADAVNLTTTPCWKRLKRLEDEGIFARARRLTGCGKGGAGPDGVCPDQDSASQQRLVWPFCERSDADGGGARLLADGRESMITCCGCRWPI